MKIIIERLPSGAARASIIEPPALAGIVGEHRSKTELERQTKQRFQAAHIYRRTRFGNDFLIWPPTLRIDAVDAL